MEENIIGRVFQQNCGDTLLVLEKTNKKDSEKGGSYLYHCIFQKYPFEVFRVGKDIKKGVIYNPQIEKVEFIDKIWEQNCGDSLKILERITEGENKGKWKCEFLKYPCIVFAFKLRILSGRVINPQIEKVEFIDKIWEQNCGDSLRILEKVTEGENKGKWKCEFLKYPCIIFAYKQDILKKAVINPQIEQVEFIDKIWHQNCGDDLRVIEKTNLKKELNNKSSYLYKCEFLKYPCICYKTKQEIQKGICVNPQIEQIEFIDKIWPQNCGDDLKIIEKVKVNNKSFFRCQFLKYPYEVIIDRKEVIINGNVDNPNLPYKSKEGILNILNTYFIDKKPTYEELAEKLNISVIYTNQQILKFGLRDYIKFTTSNLEKDLSFNIRNIFGDNIKENSFSLLKTREIDIYLPDYKLGIEFNGNLWHSNHPKLGKNNYLYHQEKSLLAQEKGIRLIHIWEWEWELYKDKILKFFKDIKFKNKIGARQCQIEELDYKIYAKFCNENHLQGEAGAKVKLGLYYKKELVQIMSFGVPRFTDKYEWEIIRECSKFGYQIIGGKERLWKYFLKKYSPNNCISYCDFSKFTGESYLKLGFKKERLNKPGFVWWNLKNNEVYWRNPYKNNELKKDNYKIFDCGQLVFSWYKN